MCIFHKKCLRPCRTHKSHFRHWEHVRKFVQKKDPAFISYRTYNRLSESAKQDLIKKKEVNKEKTSKINHINLERYHIKNMIINLINDIVNKI
jgi:hypothetical protein